ncbi:MAG: D-tyrosyl-tRNA(Tyr) deacylase [Bacteroidetes bacterium]|nr:MAG: D-tyrosyl-tRNA(Tyr) deacylase [Bacteroidota bacterium]PTM14950.1 MAG: D-tyrosyl-tRNA(Tyr) deacylase [Bacteroidota bacterium]
MRVLIQRVSEASVTIADQVKSAIGAGLLVFVGMEDADTSDDIEWLCKKITQLRIFNDAEGKMNNSVLDINGELLVISQFTLHANTKKGNRPSYITAAKPEVAIPLYELFLKQLSFVAQRPVGSGEFGADMKVRLLNDGPVTIWIDSKSRG